MVDANSSNMIISMFQEISTMFIGHDPNSFSDLTSNSIIRHKETGSGVRLVKSRHPAQHRREECILQKDLNDLMLAGYSQRAPIIPITDDLTEC